MLRRNARNAIYNSESFIASGTTGSFARHHQWRRRYVQDSKQWDQLRQWTDVVKRNSKIKFSIWSKDLEQRFALLGRKLNQFTGYELVENLKKQVVEQGMFTFGFGLPSPRVKPALTLLSETRIEAARKAARDAKSSYTHAVEERSRLQRELNDLLQRKSTWSATDVQTFTSLIHADHENAQSEASAKALVSTTDEAVEREFTNLLKVILERYHEEQVWSDKIRSASTYGGLVVMGLNVVVFIAAIVVVEPWKRRRLAQTFEGRIEKLAGETKEMVQGIERVVDEHLERQEKLLVPLTASPPKEAVETHREETKDVVYVVDIPVDQRDYWAAAMGATATLTLLGFLSLIRG